MNDISICLSTQTVRAERKIAAFPSLPQFPAHHGYCVRACVCLSISLNSRVRVFSSLPFHLPSMLQLTRKHGDTETSFRYHAILSLELKTRSETVEVGLHSPSRTGGLRERLGQMARVRQ